MKSEFLLGFLAITSLINATTPFNLDSSVQAQTLTSLQVANRIAFDASFYNQRAIRYAEQGEIHLALADYTRAIDLDPLYAPAYSNRGLLYYQRGKINLALVDLNKAIAIEPNYANAYYLLGLVHLQRQDTTAARSNFQKAKQLFTAQGNTSQAERAANYLQ